MNEGQIMNDKPFFFPNGMEKYAPTEADRIKRLEEKVAELEPKEWTSPIKENFDRYEERIKELTGEVKELRKELAQRSKVHDYGFARRS